MGSQHENPLFLAGEPAHEGANFSLTPGQGLPDPGVPMAILGKVGEGNMWRILLCSRGAGIVGAMGVEEAKALAAELLLMADLATRPGSLP
jgi:hypothetical protein